MAWTKKPPHKLEWYWFHMTIERKERGRDPCVVYGPIGDLWEFSGWSKSNTSADLAKIGEWWDIPITPPSASPTSAR